VKLGCETEPEGVKEPLKVVAEPLNVAINLTPVPVKPGVETVPLAVYVPVNVLVAGVQV